MEYSIIHRRAAVQLKEALLSMPVVALLGARQVGKTTLALEISKILKKETLYLDLELDSDFNKLSDAENYLQRFQNVLLIIDEAQRKPDLFRLLRGLVDRRKRNGERAAQFLLLGSASKDLVQQSSESLAGRIRYLELSPFGVLELVEEQGLSGFNMDALWFRGGFPDSYLAKNEKESWNWRGDFIATYLERDIPSMGVGVSATQLKRFWRMLAHYHGQQVVMSEIARSLGVSHTTVKNYLDLLTDFYMVRQLEPWSGNIKKRLVKSPKIFIRDSGILHHLLQISKFDDLFSHPIIGASWEGFVIENIITELDDRWSYSYYRTATQVELDLVLNTPNGKVWAVEVKFSSAPKLTRGFYQACEDIKADKKWVISPTHDRYPLSSDVEVIGLVDFLKLVNKV